jgi:hypothetical protein
MDAIALLSSALGGLLALGGVWLADRMARSREALAFERQLNQGKAASLEELFAGVLKLLDHGAKGFGLIRKEEGDVTELHARLTLRASSAVVAQFEKVVDALNAWADEARQGSPRPGPGGTTVFTAGFGEDKHNQKAEQLWPSFLEERERLIKMMRQEVSSFTVRSN